MELGLTIPLQKHLRIQAIPYWEETDRRFCWDLHVIPLQGRPSLLAVHCHSRYVFILFDLTRWEWERLPETFLSGLKHSFQAAGILDVATGSYLRQAGLLRMTKTHGRREVAYLNRAWEDVLAFDYTLDRSAQVQPLLDHTVNSKPCRCAGGSGIGTAEERLFACVENAAKITD